MTAHGGQDVATTRDQGSARQPLVSIVTPVHNGAEYLPECIESVLAQTYSRWDYTIVDNQSTDESLAIAYKYAARDSRIRVCANSQLLPAIANHNRALRQVSETSEYCKVVFADDWIFPECLEQMVAVAEEYPSVGLVGAYCLEGQHVICTGLPYSGRCFDGREIGRRHLLESLYLFGSANSVLYRSSLLRRDHAFFNEGNIHADTEACFELLQRSDFGFVHQVLTFTRVRPRSLTAMSTNLHTDFGGMLRILQAQGSHYLTSQELDAYLRRHIDGYYRFLGKSLLRGRDRAFWDYHRKQLEDAGLGFSRVRVLSGMLATVLGVALPWRDPMARFTKTKTRSTSPLDRVPDDSEPVAVQSSKRAG